MNVVPYTQHPQLQPEDKFRFECKKCGECCRNVAHAVMIESLDLFRIAKYLNVDVAEAANKCAETITVAWGAPILALKTKPHGDVCIFLKKGKCSIQQAKPRACRMYPLSMGPSDKNIKDFLIFKSPEKSFHYVGREYLVKEWVDANFDQEARTYIVEEYRLLQDIGRILKQIPRERENEVIVKMLQFRYLLYETNQEFMPQFKRNMKQLIDELKRLIK